jgi:hypothetical protein
MFTLDVSYKFSLTPANDMGAYTLDNNIGTGLDAEHPVMENLYSRGFIMTLGVNVNELIEMF